MAVRAVRGAIQVELNDKINIEQGVVRLIKKIITDNNIIITNIISIIFSQTKDLTTMNPASALRTIGYGDIPLFCTQEPEIINSMSRVIRVLITAESADILNPVYLEGAKKLRTDLNS